MRTIAALMFALVLSSCSPANAPDDPKKGQTTDPNAPLHSRNSDLAWSKCIFELVKIEATRGRNLDDLDKGHTSARNQFMMDCVTAQDAAVTSPQLDEMGRYLTQRDKRKPSDMTLNSGDRSMPESREKQP
ncbi:hypothetical protein [Novosphingobium sp.]|uniref:hypothetical protein n=1 Tax=Novosphingobium sp. TaxID=1874826 RepID=UPI0026284F17|nr:hypothetical protein [Novosphingobium sp.]